MTDEPTPTPGATVACLPPSATYSAGRWQVAAGAHLYLEVVVSTGVITAWDDADTFLGTVARVTPGSAKTGGPELMASLLPTAAATARATWPDLVVAE